MKRMYLIILLAVMTLSGMAQTIGDAFYIYRNDGQFNAFFRDEVISIDYSYEDADGNTYDEIVTQIVNTADSVYKIPLAAIDSVCFVTPPTVYKQDVTRMELNLLDYIIGADSLTLKLKPGTPSQIIPVIGDKLILLEGCDVLPNGFSGIVSNVHNGSISIDVVCEQAYLEDLFDSFCSASTVYGSSPDAEYASRAFSTNGSHRATYNPDDVVYSLGPYKIDRSYEVSQGIAFDGDLALTGSASFSVEIQPTLKIHTFLILGEGQGTYFQYRISGDLRVTSRSSLYGGLSYNHDFEGREIKCPIPQTGNTVNFYFNPGLFVRADATITASLTSTQIYTFGSAFDFSSKGQNTLKPSIGGRLASSSVDMSGCLDGSLAGGAYAEIGFNLLSRELAKVCVRGELGARFSGSFVFRNSDIDNATKDTKLYERLKASNIELSSFVNASLQASVAHTGNGLTWELSEPIHTWDRVPTFANTSFKQKLNPHTSADASTQLSGDCLIPVMAGLSVRDKNGNEVDDYYPSTAFDKGDKPLSYTFTNLSSDEDYTLYPKVRIFGYEMLASPSAKLDKTEMPVKITDFQQTDSHYEKDAFTNNGMKYSYKYDCAVTVELTNSENVEDWGYVYKDPFGQIARISLRSYGSPYTDTRYSYYRNESSSTVTLYEYVRYTGDSAYYYGNPKDYSVSNQWFPAKITDFKQTGSRYEKDAFTKNGKKYCYVYRCKVTVELMDSKNVEDWGYVYQISDGLWSVISLKSFDSPYSDSRTAHFRNESNSKVILKEFVKYEGDEKYYFSDEKSYDVSHKGNFSSCSDANHPHMIDFDLPSGTKWACCNVGASTPEEYGNYYAYGETLSQNVFSRDTYQYGYYDYDGDYSHLVNIGFDIAGTSYDAATVNWGNPWRMPNWNQCKELREYCTWIWTTQNGVSGAKLIGPNGFTMFLPAGGGMWNGGLHDAGSDCYYRSSSLDQQRPNYTYVLGFSSDNSYVEYGIERWEGICVRPCALE